MVGGKRRGVKKPSLDDEEEELDLSSAFVTEIAVRSRALGGSSCTSKPVEEKRKKRNGAIGHVASAVSSVAVKQGREFLIRGNLMACSGNYLDAVAYLTSAIQYLPNDYRILERRSVCYEKMGDLERALRDAEKAIELEAMWSKGHFQKGKILKALKQFREAELSFREALRLNKSYVEVHQELRDVQVQYLMEMGFPESRVRMVVDADKPVQCALDALLASRMMGTAIQNDSGEEIYYSDEEEEEDANEQFLKKEKEEEEEDEEEEQDYLSSGGLQAAAAAQLPAAAAAQLPAAAAAQLPAAAAAQPPAAATAQPPAAATAQPPAAAAAQLPAAAAVDIKLDPSNPEGLSSLWVGNVVSYVKEWYLRALFSRFGEVLSVRLLPEKSCAFINYKSQLSAGLAMGKLQGYIIGGKPVNIRFPDNPIEKTASGKVLLKMTGSFMGDECCFWRTGECFNGIYCRFLHVPAHLGIDKYQ